MKLPDHDFSGQAKIFIFAWILVTVGCIYQPQYYHIGTVASPNGSLVADWYERMDGGPVGSSEDQVTIHGSKTAYSRELPYVFAGISADNLKIVWSSETQLAITYPRDTTVTKALREWNGLKIDYAMDPHMSRKRSR